MTPFKNVPLFFSVSNAELGTPFLTIRKTFHGNLKMLPYKLSVLHQSWSDEYSLQFKKTYLTHRESRKDSKHLDRVKFSDDYVFHNNGVVNKHNVWFWCREYPHGVVEVLQNSEKVMVLCTMLKTKIIYPHVFVNHR